MIHIIPRNDINEHEEETTCICHPKIEFLENGDILVIHNAFDKREDLTENINLN